jgi:hypothetical protein
MISLILFYFPTFKVHLGVDSKASGTFLLRDMGAVDAADAVGAEVFEETVRRALGTMRVGERCRVHAKPE